MQYNPPPSIPPLTPLPNQEDDLPTEPPQLPDLGPGVEIVALPEMDIGFNVDYLTSHEQAREGDSDSEEILERDESDIDMERGRGLEEILWPPKLLLQARNYGMRKRIAEHGSGSRLRCSQQRREAHTVGHANDNLNVHGNNGDTHTELGLPEGMGLERATGTGMDTSTGTGRGAVVPPSVLDRGRASTMVRLGATPESLPNPSDQLGC